MNGPFVGVGILILGAVLTGVALWITRNADVVSEEKEDDLEEKEE